RSSRTDARAVTRVRGRVKVFHPRKRYGFITRDDGGPDALVHVRLLALAGIRRRDFSPGAPVEFDDAGGVATALTLLPDDDPRETSGVVTRWNGRNGYIVPDDG